MKNKPGRRLGSWLAGPLIFLFLVTPAIAQYREALPGYRYNFPADYFNHPEYQTEWWYYTGNVKSATGHAFGFQLTFFRQGTKRTPKNESPWAIEDLYLAHLALSDIDGHAFYHRERLNRRGPGLAGIAQDKERIWNGNWQVEFHGDHQELVAVADVFTLRLTLESRKPPVINGIDGVSQKSQGHGHASHYISLTRLSATGTIEVNGKTFTVEGTAWMDHEFFTHHLDPEQIGWDWVSLQLNDNTELMLFHLRRKDGSIDAYSAGTYVDRDGKPRNLHATEFVLEPRGERWVSPASGTAYPIRWHVQVSSLGLDLNLTTPLPEQEMTGKTRLAPGYWEGAIRIAGTRDKSPVDGVGYLEMTGYGQPINLNP